MAPPGEGDEATSDDVDLVRVLTLTDGVFAIAMTLLVLGIDVPDNLKGQDAIGDALYALLPDFGALVLSFVVIGRFWVAHHQIFKRVPRGDMTLVWLNLWFLAPVALTPFSTKLLADYGEYPTPTAVYAATIAACGLLAFSLQFYADRRLGASRGNHAGLIIGIVFLASVPIAYWWHPDAAKYSWLSLLIAPSVFAAVRKRRTPAPGRASA